MMTRVLFIPDDRSVILLDSALPANELAAEVNAGSWQPPPPYGSPTTEPCDDAVPGVQADRSLYALPLEQLVIITTISKQTLTQNKSTWERKRQAFYEKNSLLPPEIAAAEEDTLTLSPRQMEVLRGLAEGLNTKQIALHLQVTTRTVRFHIQELKLRFGAHTHAELVGRAAALELLKDY